MLSPRHVFVVSAFAITLGAGAAQLRATEANAQASAEKLFATLSVGGWTDDKIVQLAAALPPGRSSDGDALLQKAILDPVFPEGGRPDNFFNVLSAYFDADRDGAFTAAEVRETARAYAARYADLLRESRAAGPSEELAAGYRVKTWKMLQKILLLQHTLEERKAAEWKYSPGDRPLPSEGWDQEHTLTSAVDFRSRVCEASAKVPVVVKFGSTQCADCTLMEFTQGVRIASEKAKDKFSLYKFWWGPNVAPDNDRLRKGEGVKSSPTFVVYRSGRRYSCGFAFLDESGDGLDACLSASAKSEAMEATPACAPASGS